MGLLRAVMPLRLQLLALLAFAVAMFFLENQIQKLEESRGKLGKFGSAARPVPPQQRVPVGVSLLGSGEMKLHLLHPSDSRG